jgi:hypothetical protein
VSIKTRVRSTVESLVGDTEVLDHRHRTHRIYEVTGQLDVPTSLTSVPSHLLCFHFVCCCVKEVSKWFVVYNEWMKRESKIRPTGTPKDKDEVSRREVCDCDG